MPDNKPSLIFKDKFKVLDVNCPDNFDKINRIHAEGCNTNADLILDLYQPLCNPKKESCLIVTLMEPKEDEKNRKLKKIQTRSNYSMRGKIYSFEVIKQDDSEDVIQFCASFGGLLLRLIGEYKRFIDFTIDKEVLLFMEQSKTD